MERFLQAIKSQSNEFILGKIFIFGALTVLVYGEVYSELFSDRSYKSKWNCFSKTAFRHPNPYYGDVNVSDEFTNLIDAGFLLCFGGAISNIFGGLLSHFSL